MYTSYLDGCFSTEFDVLQAHILFNITELLSIHFAQIGSNKDIIISILANILIALE